MIHSLTILIGFREQTNLLTHFLDASVVYGSSEEEMEALRNFTGGYLNYRSTGENEQVCSSDRASASEKYCFLPNFDIKSYNVFQIYAGNV